MIVTLNGPAGFTARTTTTDSTGAYSFTGVPVAASGSQYSISVPSTITVAGTVCNNPVVPTIPVLTPTTPNQPNQNVPYSPITGSISGFVYCLSNGVKVYAPGVTVTLNGPSGFTPLTTTTGTDGSYAFTGIPVASSGSQYSISVPATVTVNGTVCNNPVVPTIPVLTPTTPNQPNQNIPYSPAPASLSGLVYCDVNKNKAFDTGEMLIGGVTVTLTNSAGATVATTTTKPDGTYSFTGLAAGSYTITVPAAITDETIETTNPLTGTLIAGQSSTGNNFGYMALPINYRYVMAASGAAYFGTTSVFTSRASATVTLTQTDLFNAAYANASFGTSYKYVGTIPDFPELGHFGGVGEPTIYVFLATALLPTNQWNSLTVTNQIGILGLQGTGAVGLAGNYLYRFQFNHPFDGPGTAHNYTLTQTESSAGSLTPLKITQISSVYIGSGATPPTPALSDVPPGWMARGIGEYSLPPNTGTDVFVDGTYTDVCGMLFSFRLTPIVKGGPK